MPQTLLTHLVTDVVTGIVVTLLKDAKGRKRDTPVEAGILNLGHNYFMALANPSTRLLLVMLTVSK